MPQIAETWYATAMYCRCAVRGTVTAYPHLRRDACGVPRGAHESLRSTRYAQAALTHEVVRRARLAHVVTGTHSLFVLLAPCR